MSVPSRESGGGGTGYVRVEDMREETAMSLAAIQYQYQLSAMESQKCIFATGSLVTLLLACLTMTAFAYIFVCTRSEAAWAAMLAMGGVAFCVCVAWFSAWWYKFAGAELPHLSFSVNNRLVSP